MTSSGPPTAHLARHAMLDGAALLDVEFLQVSDADQGPLSRPSFVEISACGIDAGIDYLLESRTFSQLIDREPEKSASRCMNDG